MVCLYSCLPQGHRPEVSVRLMFVYVFRVFAIAFVKNEFAVRFLQGTNYSMYKKKRKLHSMLNNVETCKILRFVCPINIG